MLVQNLLQAKYLSDTCNSSVKALPTGHDNVLEASYACLLPLPDQAAACAQTAAGALLSQTTASIQAAAAAAKLDHMAAMPVDAFLAQDAFRH